MEPFSDQEKIEKEKFNLLKQIRAMQANYQKDKAVLNQKVDQMEQEIQITRQRESNLKKSYHLLLNMFQNSQAGSKKNFVDEAIIESFRMKSLSSSVKTKDILAGNREQLKSHDYDNIYQKVMNIGDFIVKNDTISKQIFENEPSTVDKGQKIREKFLKEKFGKTEEPDKITPFKLKREDLFTFNSTEKVKKSRSRSNGIKQKMMYGCGPKNPQKNKKFTPKKKKKKISDMNNSSFYKQVFNKDSEKKLKLKQKLYNYVQEKRKLNSPITEKIAKKFNFEKENLVLKAPYQNEKKNQESKSIITSKKSKPVDILAKYKKGRKSRSRNKNEKNSKFSKNLDSILHNGKKAMKKRKASCSNKFLNSLKIMKAKNSIPNLPFGYQTHYKEKKNSLGKFDLEKSIKKIDNHTPALKNLKSNMIGHKKGRPSFKSHSSSFMNKKYQNLKKILKEKNEIFDPNKSDLKTRKHRFSSKGNSFIDMIDHKRSFYKTRSNLNLNQHKTDRGPAKGLNFSLIQNKNFSTHKNILEYKKSNLSLGASKKVQSTPYFNKEKHMSKKLSTTQIKEKLSFLTKRNTSFDIVNHKTSLFTDRSSKPQIQISLSNIDDKNKIINIDSSGPKNISIRIEKSEEKNFQRKKENLSFLQNVVSNKKIQDQLSSQRFRTKPVSSYFKGRVTRTPFKTLDNFFKRNSGLDERNSFLNSEKKKMDYSLIVQGSESIRERRKSEIDNYSAIKRTQNMINRKFRNLENNFNKSDNKIKSFLG